MGIGKMKWKIENGKSDFSFFCFRFTIYSEAQIFFIDIHLLFKKHSGENSRNEINWWYGRGELRCTSIFLRKVEAIVFHILQIFCNATEKLFTNSLLFSTGEVFFLSVLWYEFMNKKIFPFFCNNHKTKTLPHLRARAWGLKIVEYHSGNIRISSSLNWGLFLLTHCVYISRAWVKIFDGS